MNDILGAEEGQEFHVGVEVVLPDELLQRCPFTCLLKVWFKTACRWWPRKLPS